MNTQWDLYRSGISLSGYGSTAMKPRDRYRACAAVMKSGLSSRIRAYPAACAAAISSSSMAPPVPARRYAGSTHMRLISAVPGPIRCRAAVPTAALVLERQEEPPVRRLELGDGAEVVLDGLLDRQPEAVPRLEPVVAPGEVVEPEAYYRIPIQGQVSLPNLGRA
jgi:hypothetical protein